MIEITIFVILMIIALFQWRKTKSESLLFGIILATSSFAIKKLNLPIELGLSLWAFFGFSVLLYKFFQKRTEKYLYIFSLVFLGCGIVFLLQSIDEMGHKEYIFKLFK